MLDRYLTVLDVEPTTRSTYEAYIRNHIRPVLGELPLGRLEPETIETFYAQLRVCRSRCGGRQPLEHRTTADHVCDGRCRRHECRPLSASSVRQIHAILSSACRRAVRWKWIGANPVADAEPPAAVAPNRRRRSRRTPSRWRASNLPDNGPYKVRTGMEDGECQNRAGVLLRSSRTKR